MSFMKTDVSDEKDSVIEKVVELNMSRGDKQEIPIDFEAIRDKIVYDEMGNQIRFGDIYKHQKTIIVFTRHFLCFICKDYVEDLAIVPLEYLQEANVRLVVIGPAPYKFIKNFRKETGFVGTMYTDPERELYQLLKLKDKTQHGQLKGSKHIKQGLFMGIMKSMWRAMQVQEYQGNVAQQGGAFVIGPGEVIHHAHIEKNATDQCPINDLLEEAGVQLVSFPKDTRVMHL
ncbi:hypothetical protein FSP39_016606 [Pinctada imbricata]|uniref:Uncharacterized protein n=1 Tax=Pinctada imbricata TaxID=66713 RepID=A0AA88XVC8_PINIB|nr:hypothetical protein FSP39_016606 [Pinctada imbricata]